MTNIAAKDYKAAETASKELIKLRKDRLGDNHPKVGEALSLLGSAYEGQGKFVDAKNSYLEAALIQHIALGPDSLLRGGY